MALSVYQWEVEEVAMAKILIVGLGVSGQAVARYLYQNDIAFGLADERVCGADETLLRQTYPEMTLHCGAFEEDIFLNYETIVLSPGISRKHPAVAAAIAAGVEVICDIEVFARVVNAPVIAVTGSNGKSTVVDLLQQMAQSANIDSRLGGNYGVAALDLVDEQEAELYILELSSFQLESTYSLKPAAAVVLNISEDHMDRYDGLPDYIEAKAKVYKQAAHQIINRDDMQARELSGSTSSISFGLDTPDENHFGLIKIDEVEWLAQGETALLPVNELKILGRHNIANALAALALGQAVNIPMVSMLSALRNYQGLSHRTQWVADINGVTWINDSKATNVGATQAALQGMEAPVILLAGGQAKGADLTPLTSAATNRIKTAILFGEDADQLELVLNDACDVIRVDDLPAAVFHANEIAQNGDVVMLSPACASFDMFSSYTERGDVFIRLVNGLQVNQ